MIRITAICAQGWSDTRKSSCQIFRATQTLNRTYRSARFWLQDNRAKGMVMRLLIWLVVFVALVDGSPAVAAQDTEANLPKMAHYFVGLIYRGPTWSPEVTQEVQELQAAHLANIGRLVESGEMVLAGPFADDGDLRGLFFYNVDTLEAAQALVESDPAVKSGRLRVELHPWWGPTSLATLLRTKESESP